MAQSRRIFIAIAASTVIAWSGCTSSDRELLDCQFIPVEFAEDELSGCGYVDRTGQLVLLPKTIAEVQKRASDPVAAIIGSTLYYVNSAGKSATVLWYDNGADYFQEGLARTTRDGKVGFIDRGLTEIIAPSWDFAFPFDGGLAMVCQGCRPHPVDDEYSEMRGGVWGYIDREGKAVVPVQFKRELLPPPPGQ